MPQKTVEVNVTGRVQGVGFRFWTVEQAMKLGLAGWVRNERDGSVRALLHGPVGVVEAMLELLRQGPPGSAVRGVAVRPAPAFEGEGFRMER